MALVPNVNVASKRPRYNNWYFKLESESSAGTSQDDTESVYSIQNRETDVARDTSDTDTKSDFSDSDVQVEIEYDVATASEGENPFEDSSSGTDDALAAAGAIAAAICDSSLEAWATDVEDSDTSSLDDTSLSRFDYFWRCARCKTQNNSPMFQLCEKCYQVRKSFFPPRPRKHKRVHGSSQELSSQDEPVRLESLQSCLSGISSQDSGIGSSQEFPALQLDKIVVPKHLTGNLSDIKNSSPNSANNRKRQFSESSLSDVDDVKSFKRTRLKQTEKETVDHNKAKSPCKETANSSKETGNKIQETGKGEIPDNSVKPHESKELCILCNANPKNSIFLHGSIAHMCCCYKCAIRTWGTNKRCPVCNCKVKNVVKVFTI